MAKQAMIDFLETCEPSRETPRSSTVVEKVADELLKSEISAPEDLLYCDPGDIQLASAGQKSLLRAAIACAQIKFMQPPVAPVLSDDEEYEMPSHPADAYFPPFICPKGADHCPVGISKRKHIKGWLF